ncbi:hypothetical protein V9K67_01170 [Paraflavisolibacter sp. H34]
MRAGGYFLCLLYLFKGVTAWGLWTGKDWAITFGLVDALAGIVLCTAVMFLFPLIPSLGNTFTLRLELLVLVPYLLQLQKMKPLWIRSGM